MGRLLRCDQRGHLEGVLRRQWRLHKTGVDQAHADAAVAQAKKAEAEVHARLHTFLSIKGKRTTSSFHRELGMLMWNNCGMARSEASLQQALSRIPEIKEEFWNNLNVLGSGLEMNNALEQAGRVADFIEFAELMCWDALERDESCGGHFRTEHQTQDGEAKRNDQDFCHSAVWEYTGTNSKSIRHKEELTFENIQLATRSYK